MLAAAALVARRNLGRLALAAGGTISLGVAVGLPPLPAILELLPGFDVTNNSRLIVVFTLCLALLAGWGLHDLLDPARLLRRGPVLALAMGILAVPVVWVLVAGERPWFSMLDDSLKVAWGFADWPRLYPVATAAELERLVAETRLAALIEWLVVAGAGAALLWLRLSGRLGTSAFAALALLLVTADLFKAGVGINPAISIDHADQPVTPSLRYLQERTPNRFVGLRSTLPLSPGNPLPADLAMRYGLLDARGYDFPIEDRYHALLAARDRAGQLRVPLLHLRSGRLGPRPARPQPAQRRRRDDESRRSGTQRARARSGLQRHRRPHLLEHPRAATGVPG